MTIEYGRIGGTKAQFDYYSMDFSCKRNDKIGQLWEWDGNEWKNDERGMQKEWNRIKQDMNSGI